MSTIAGIAPGGLGPRLWSAIVGAWGVVMGIAPHVLHHLGPLAGAALLAGAGGKAIFFAAGLALSVPMLRRLYGRFGTWIAPALAVLAFAVLFTVSSLVIAPRITGSETVATAPTAQPAPTAPAVPGVGGHAVHH